MDGDGTQAGEVDERIAQLQHALGHRVVIEQAKGMLAERYSLSPDDAYELILLAARSNGIKAHAVSRSIVASPRRTPPEILALLPGSDREPARPHAVGNVFREINESFLELGRPEAESRFICECADPSCAQPIEFGAESMQRLRKRNGLYLVVRAHVTPPLDEVVATYDGLAIVRRPPGATA